jgi:uncharacterized protein (DUF58 family)
MWIVRIALDRPYTFIVLALLILTTAASVLATAALGLIAFVPFVGALEDILCVQAERVVGNDNTVRYAGRVLQIPEQRHRRHFVKVTVRVHEYPDGRLAVFHGPRRLADYEPDGTLIDQISPARTAA